MDADIYIRIQPDSISFENFYIGKRYPVLWIKAPTIGTQGHIACDPLFSTAIKTDGWQHLHRFYRVYSRRTRPYTHRIIWIHSMNKPLLGAVLVGSAIF